MDLSKLFDTINHDLFIAIAFSMAWYMASVKTLVHWYEAVYLSDYFNNHWQRVKINTILSYWKELLQGVPNASILDNFCLILLY